MCTKVLIIGTRIFLTVKQMQSREDYFHVQDLITLFDQLTGNEGVSDTMFKKS